MIVLPCLGFDARAFRLGYGGGFYDRTLAEFAKCEKNPHPVLTIGVAYDDAEIQGFEPHTHDRALDWIITQARRIRPVR